MSYGARERVIQKQFEDGVADHQMTVLRDEGDYRHLRFCPPGSYNMGFDIVTWPGYLAYTGDMGNCIFSRTRDMLKFFRRTGDQPIDFRYWAEKLQGFEGGQSLARHYAPSQLQPKLDEWLKEYAESRELSGAEALALREAIQDQVLDREMVQYSETMAHHYLREFDYKGITLQSFAEELDLKEFDYRFLWCCFALAWAIDRYDKRAADASSSTTTPREGARS